MNIKYHHILIAIFSAFLLNSCFVAKDYQKEEIDTSNLYRTEMDMDSSSMADISWRAFFSDPLLINYIDTALANNKDALIALQTILVAESNMKQGKAGYVPVINLDGSFTSSTYSENSQFGSIFSGAINQFELAPTLTWEIDVWGKIRSQKRATEAAFLQSLSAQQAIYTQLIAEVATTYYQLVALDEQLKIAENSLENREKSIEITQALLDQGETNSLALKQTIAQKYETELTIEEIKYNMVLLENSFNLLLGQSPQSVERAADFNPDLNSDVKVGVPALLLSNRPDLVQAELTVRQMFELTNVARSQFYPSITLTASAGFQSLEFNNWFSAKSIFTSLIAGLSQPILNQRQIRTEYETALANKESAILGFESTLLTAGKEVSDALATLGYADRNISIRTQEVEILTTAVEDAEALQQSGNINYLEVITVKDNALTAKLSLIDDKFNRLSAMIELYRALGGGRQ